jgi:hypothetical protein
MNGAKKYYGIHKGRERLQDKHVHGNIYVFKDVEKEG